MNSFDVEGIFEVIGVEERSGWGEVESGAAGKGPTSLGRGVVTVGSGVADSGKDGWSEFVATVAVDDGMIPSKKAEEVITRVVGGVEVAGISPTAEGSGFVAVTKVGVVDVVHSEVPVFNKVISIRYVCALETIYE